MLNYINYVNYCVHVITVIYIYYRIGLLLHINKVTDAQFHIPLMYYMYSLNVALNRVITLIGG